MNKQTRKNLAGLRLVNKSFCHSASIRLFRHIIALAGSLCHTTHLPSVGKLVGISSSQYAQYVSHVDLGYGSLPCSVEDIILYTEDLVGLLSSCLRQFPNLKALDFSGPPLTSLSHDKLKASIDPILTALCYVPLPNLTELEIQLPMTNDFAPLFAEKISTLRIPTEQILSRLHYLGLHVYAQTNQQSCAAHLLSIVELSTSLTSLSLSSTNYLNIDRLKLGSTVHLQLLSLHKLKTPSRNFVNIIEQCSESMQYIELRHVKLETGTWREILHATDSLPHLETLSNT
jgi:Leucine-rich repeat (LRR) protein